MGNKLYIAMYLTREEWFLDYKLDLDDSIIEFQNFKDKNRGLKLDPIKTCELFRILYNFFFRFTELLIYRRGNLLQEEEKRLCKFYEVLYGNPFPISTDYKIAFHGITCAFLRFFEKLAAQFDKRYVDIGLWINIDEFQKLISHYQKNVLQPRVIEA